VLIWGVGGVHPSRQLANQHQTFRVSFRALGKRCCVGVQVVAAGQGHSTLLWCTCCRQLVAQCRLTPA
jgi:hypothetical protein